MLLKVVICVSRVLDWVGRATIVAAKDDSKVENVHKKDVNACDPRARIMDSFQGPASGPSTSQRTLIRRSSKPVSCR